MTHEEKIIERLKTEQMLSAEELDCLLATEDTEAVERLRAEARTAAQAVYGKQIYIRGLIEFTAKMTVITAVSAGAMHVPSATGSRRSRSSPAARRGMSLDSAPLCCRAEKTPILRMKGSATWCLPSSGRTRTAR